MNQHADLGHENEVSLIASMMLSPSAIPTIDIRADELRDERHQHIVRVILDQFAAAEPTDALAIAGLLEREGKPGLMRYVLDISRDGIVSSDPARRALTVRTGAKLRAAETIARSLLAASRSGEVTGIDDAVRELMELGRAEARHEFSGRQIAQQAFAEVQAAYESGGKLRGISTGIDRLDERLGGWHRGDVIFVGARPSVGKTALLLNFARAAHAGGHAVGLISAEQPGVQIAQRHIAMGGKIPADLIRSARLDSEQWSAFGRAMSELADAKYWIYDRSQPDIAEVVRVARKWKHMHGIEILLVDYVQRIGMAKLDRAPRWERVGAVAAALKNIARDLDIPVVALAQVSRAVEQRADQRPKMSDLADSSEIEKEADAILMAYRDEVARPQAPDVEKGVMELALEKNRHGPVGRVKVAFLAPTMRVANLSREPMDTTDPGIPFDLPDTPEGSAANTTSGRDRAAGDDA